MARIIGLIFLLLGSIVSGFGKHHAQSNPAASPDTILATHHIEMVNFAFGQHEEVDGTHWSAPVIPTHHFSFESTVIEEEQQDEKNSSSKKNSSARLSIDLALNQALSLLLAHNSERDLESCFYSHTSHKLYLVIQVFRV